MQDGYDREKVSGSFKESAEVAENFYRSNVQNGHRDTNAALRHDEWLARWLTYEHLKDGEFLQSRESLLTELRWLLKNGRPLAPRQSLDRARFAVHRAALLQKLIQRFEVPGE